MKSDQDRPLRIALVTPPVYQAPLPLEVHLPMIPQGPAMMAAVLRQRGHQVACFDAYELSCRERHFDVSKFVAFLEREQPDWLGLSVYSDGYPAALAMADVVRTVLPNCVLVGGGPHFTLLPDSAPAVFDYLVVGEGEVPLALLVEGRVPPLESLCTRDIYFVLRDAGSGTPYDGNCNFLADVTAEQPLGPAFECLQVVRGNLRRAANKHTVVLTMQGRLSNEFLGRLPFPAYDLFLGPESSYQFDEPALGLDGPMLNLNTSRGCSYGCSFCSVEGVWGKSYRWFPTPWILGLVANLKARYGIRSVFFREDEFIMGPRAPSAWHAGEEARDAVLALATGLHDLGIRWAIENRADAFGSRDRAEGYFKRLAELGLAGVFVGVESASDTVRNDILNKHLSEIAIRTFFRWAREANVCTVANIMYGVRIRKNGELLSDGPADWIATDALLADLRPTRVDRYVYVGVPISPLYRDYLDRGDFELIDVNGYLYPKGFENIAREIYGDAVEMLTIPGHPNLRVGPGLLPGIPSALDERMHAAAGAEAELANLQRLPGVLDVTLTSLNAFPKGDKTPFGIVDEFLDRVAFPTLEPRLIRDLLKDYQPGDRARFLRLPNGPSLVIATLRTPSAEAILLALQLAHNVQAKEAILAVVQRVAVQIGSHLRSRFLRRYAPANQILPLPATRRHLQMVSK